MRTELVLGRGFAAAIRTEQGIPMRPRAPCRFKVGVAIVGLDCRFPRVLCLAPVCLGPLEEVVADRRPPDRHVLPGAHELVAALLTLLDEDEGAVDELPAFVADRVEDRNGIARPLRGSAP